tara:strand:- start:323 stop:982 length:660 start_codon:yes stop_codon:yes gene_type:complete
MSNDEENMVKDMIQAQQSIINRQSAIKNQRIPGPFSETEEGHYRKFIIGQITDKFKIQVTRNDITGAYITIGEKNQKRALVTKYVNNLIRQLDDAARKGILTKQGNFMTVVSEAIYGNKKLIVLDGQLVTDENENFFGDLDGDGVDDSKILGKGAKKQRDPIDPKKTRSNEEIIKEIRRNGKNTVIGTKAFNELVKNIQDKQNISNLQDAINEANKLIK